MFLSLTINYFFPTKVEMKLLIHTLPLKQFLKDSLLGDTKGLGLVSDKLFSPRGKLVELCPLTFGSIALGDKDSEIPQDFSTSGPLQNWDKISYKW